MPGTALPVAGSGTAGEPVFSPAGAGGVLEAGAAAAGAGLGHGERADLLAGEGGLRVTFDEIRVAAADDVRQRDAMGEQRREHAARPAVVEDLLVDDGGVDRVA